MAGKTAILLVAIALVSVQALVQEDLLLETPQSYTFPSGSGETGTIYSVTAEFKFDQTFSKSWTGMWHLSKDNINVPRNPALFLLNSDLTLHPCFTSADGNGNNYATLSFNSWDKAQWYTITQIIRSDGQVTIVKDEAGNEVSREQQTGQQSALSAKLDGTILHFCHNIAAYAPTSYIEFAHCRNLRFWKNYALTDDDFSSYPINIVDPNAPVTPAAGDGTCDDTTFYSECNYSGEQASGSSEVSCMSFTPKSVCVAAGKKVTLFNHCDFQGQTAQFNSNIECTDNMNFSLLEQNGLKLSGKKNLKANKKTEKVTAEIENLE